MVRKMKRSRYVAFGDGNVYPVRGPTKRSKTEFARIMHTNRVPYCGRRGYRPNKVEKKVADLTVANYVADTTGAVTTLALPILGSDMTNRIGRKIQMKSLYIRGVLQRESTAVDTVHDACLCRLIIVYDKQPNGAVPAITDILVTSSSISQLNLNNRDRFQVIKDKQWVLGPYWTQSTATTSFAVADRVTYPVKIFKKLNLETVFNAANGGTIADINTGALFMVTIGHRADGGSFSVCTRVRYDDK